jgi:dolichyl-phosphate-mannose-protein mannosyltransferase
LNIQTRYETRTRILDSAGNELYEGPVEGNYAPPHPDVEGANPETPAVPKSDAPEQPPVADVETDLLKEKSAEEEGKKPKPASEGNEATVA